MHLLCQESHSSQSVNSSFTDKARYEIQSSLVLRFVNNDFQENKEPTIGGTASPLAHPLSPTLPFSLL